MKTPKAYRSTTILLLLFLLFSLSAAGCEIPPPGGANTGDKLIHYSSPIIPLKEILKAKDIQADSEFSLYVNLSTYMLYFKYEDEVLKRYSIGVGKNTSLGDKQREGDMRTPRGQFYICSKAIFDPAKKGFGSRWMQLSYPNMEAAERGLEKELISEEVYNTIKEAFNEKKTPPQNTPLGSGVGIHGGAGSSLPRNWTAGCIGMYNRDIEEIFKYVKIGTCVTIEWDDENSEEG